MPSSNSSLPYFEQIDTVIEKMLVLFKRYEIHATWATVGLLLEPQLLDQPAFAQAIPYEKSTYSPFPVTTEKYGHLNHHLISAGKSVEKIKNTPGQEIASHTHSHFYTCETGITANDFEQDCKRMKTIGEYYQLQFESIVFPRNQVNFLAICKDYGFKAYRGNQENKFWKNSAYANESILKKIGRVTDAYLQISKTSNPKTNCLERKETLLNIPASRFLRPCTRIGLLERRKLRRIKNEMRRAAKKQELYHLWWHPHNFTVNTDIALNQLEEILAYAIVLQKKYGFESLNMSEIAQHAQ